MKSNLGSIHDFIIDSFEISVDLLTNELDFTKLDCWDSLKYMTFVMDFEAKFELTLDRRELMQITSYEGLISVLEEKGILIE